ncbi:DNA polymerase III subunit delta [Spirochaetia bacterium]|nr:DNA polymerase III subunit delta [Spirochaetia bacterium]
MAKGRCLLFLGPEAGEKQDALSDLRRSLEKQYKAPAEETSFYAGETSVSEIAAALRNGSLFSDARLFLIKNAEVFKKKEELELLSSYMAAPQDDTTLILISDEIGLAKALEAKAEKRIFWELFEEKKAEWVASCFKREGFKISEGAIETILEMVENNTEALRRECSRLMLFLGKDAPATGEDVEKWLSHSREESAFTLFSRIATGDLMKSIETLHILLDAKEKSRTILAGLAWCFRTLRDYHALVAAGETGDFEFKKIGLGSSRKRKDYAEANRRYVADACLSLIAEFDVLVHSAGTGPEPVLMDLFLYKLITGAGAPRETWTYY